MTSIIVLVALMVSNVDLVIPVSLPPLDYVVDLAGRGEEDGGGGKEGYRVLRAVGGPSSSKEGLIPSPLPPRARAIVVDDLDSDDDDYNNNDATGDSASASTSNDDDGAERRGARQSVQPPPPSIAN